MLLSYLEGQGDLVSRLTAHITHVAAIVMPVINLFLAHLLCPHDPPRREP